MIKRLAVVFIGIAVILACSVPAHERVGTPPANTVLMKESEYAWTRLADSAAWKRSYNYQMLASRDTLWVLHHDGTWFTADGVSWKKSSLSNVIGNQAFLDYVEFKGMIYGLGSFEGNIERFQFAPRIFVTSNMKTWRTLSDQTNLPVRFFYHPFVFEDKIWIIGGEDNTRQYADIWNSEDGINWVKRGTDLPFGARSSSQVVMHRGKLFLLNNDVWSSTDGLHWVREVEAIVPAEEVFGYAAVVYDGKIWLIGCNRNGKFESQVFVSEDGRNWKGQFAPWSPRGAVAAAVFKDQIYMTGGKYGGLTNDGRSTDFVYSNDLWVLGKK